MIIPPSVKEQLRKPLGALHTDFREIKRLSRTHKIISVGDVCTLALLAMGIPPHLAVFDHLYMRRTLDPGMVRILDLQFPRQKRYKNPAGTLSERLLRDAPMLIEEGGGVLIEGEEDLTAMAFIRSAGKDCIVVYGQPKAGMVIVRPDERIKKKIEKWLSASTAALGHEIEGDEGEQ
jgi:GTP-dependent dephospho-CoA kinase